MLLVDTGIVDWINRLKLCFTSLCQSILIKKYLKCKISYLLTLPAIICLLPIIRTGKKILPLKLTPTKAVLNSFYFKSFFMTFTWHLNPNNHIVFGVMLQEQDWGTVSWTSRQHGTKVLQKYRMYHMNLQLFIYRVSDCPVISGSFSSCYYQLLKPNVCWPSFLID